MEIRQRIEQWEQQQLSPFAATNLRSVGRERPETPCPFRTDYRRDLDRILYSKAFRRLKHKTQVFLQPEGDHYRTRMTHTLEVAAISRTIARSLKLNEDLVEAIAYGHDLGHTPFGHAGEQALDEVFGFRHNEQSLRVVDVLEKDGVGMNLTYEVRMGIYKHTGESQPETLEGSIVRLADKIAYINHDIDDAVRGGVLKNEDLPKEITGILGDTLGRRIDSLVGDIVRCSDGKNAVVMSPEIYGAMMSLREFMFENVYRNPVAKGEESKARDMLKSLFAYYIKKPEKLPGGFLDYADECGVARAACDYIAGMTDQYAVNKYSEAFIPSTWQIHS